jgi:hypothetical protein
MIAKRITSLAAAIAAAVWLGVACADRVAGPPTEVIVPFAIDAERRAALSAALVFVSRSQSMNALADREGAARISEALVRLGDRIVHNDLNGTQLALDAARGAVDGYRARAITDAAEQVEIETMALALEHVALLATKAPDVSRYSIRESR